MKTIRYNRYVFFDKKAVGSAKKLAKKYGVRFNSYAGEVLRRVYYFYFGDATDIKKEFKKYYIKEYDDYNKYLECHFGFPKDIISRLEGTNICYVNLDEKGEQIGNSFSDDNELKSQFWGLVGGLEDENPSGKRYEQFIK